MFFLILITDCIFDKEREETRVFSMSVTDLQENSDNCQATRLLERLSYIWILVWVPVNEMKLKSNCQGHFLLFLLQRNAAMRVKELEMPLCTLRVCPWNWERACEHLQIYSVLLNCPGIVRAHTQALSWGRQNCTYSWEHFRDKYTEMWKITTYKGHIFF